MEGPTPGFFILINKVCRIPTYVQASIEGLHWLVGTPYTLAGDILFVGDEFEAGDLVVKVRYYKMVKKDLEDGFRVYALQTGTLYQSHCHGLMLSLQ